MNKRAGLVLGVIVIAAIGWLLWRRAAGTATTAGTAATETAVVKRGTLQVTVDATGKLAPVREVAVSFAAGGNVASVLAKVGDQVAAGQPLATLETSDLALQLASAKAGRSAAAGALASARSSLAEVQAGPSANALETAKVQLEKAKDSRWGAQAQRDSICGQVERKRAEQAACDSAQASVQGAEGSVRLAELQYQTVLAGATSAELLAARDKVRQAESQLASADNQLQQAQLKLDQATLISPITGTVTAMNLHAGERFGGGTAAATVSDLSALLLEVALDQTDVASLRVGQPAEVKADAFPDQIVAGKVTAIAPSAQTQSGVVLFPVTIGLEPITLPLRSGMTANTSIILTRTEGALIVPRRAIRTFNGGSFVEVQTDLGPNRAAVTLGATNDSEAQVLTGVNEGDVVIVTAVARARTTGPGGGVPGFGGGGFIPGGR